MADDILIEQESSLSGVVDKQSQRNLLEDPTPLLVDAAEGKSKRVALEIKNGQEGLIDLAVSSDEPWLHPETSRLTLVGGESGDCIVSIKPEGDAEYGNLLFSWEGLDQTRCVSVMFLRDAGASADAGAVPKPPPPAPDKPSQAVKTLVAFVDGCGGPNKFIGKEEEDRIFRKGGALGLTSTQTETVLNRRCASGGWTRQTRLTKTMTSRLHEAAQRAHRIDKPRFDHIVNLAARRFMPREDAEEHCATLILDEGLVRFVKQGTFNKWFDKLRKRYGC